MLLIGGGAQDPNILRLLEHATASGIEVCALLVGPDAHPRIDWDLEADRLVLDGGEIRPNAVFLRYDVFTNLADGRPESLARASAWYAAVAGWALAHPDVRFLNRGSRDSGANKPHALQLARACGLTVPFTRVTNDLDVLEALERERPMIAKPVDGGAHTQALGALLETSERREHSAAAPAITQERLVAPEVRVYVVGERVFPFRIFSSALDYRTSTDTQVRALADLPAEIGHGVLRLLEALSMDWGAADFKACEKTGELRFLEINSGPMFVAFDLACGGALCDGMLEWLVGSP